MALPVGKGQKVSQYADVLGDLEVTCSNDAGVIAGEVYSSSPFVVICGYAVTKDGSNKCLFPGWVEGHYVVTKKTGTAWVKGDPIHFEAVGAHDYLQADVAVAGETIHAYAFKAALSGDVEGQIIGPFMPPFQIVGEGTADAIAAALAALVDGADEGQILIADGSDGIALTDYHVPTADGTNGQVLKQDDANSLAWADDSDIVKTLVAGKTDGQVIVANGSNGVDVTLWHVAKTDGTAGQQLETDGSLAVAWQAAT